MRQCQAVAGAKYLTSLVSISPGPSRQPEQSSVKAEEEPSLLLFRMILLIVLVSGPVLRMDRNILVFLPPSSLTRYQVPLKGEAQPHRHPPSSINMQSLFIAAPIHSPALCKSLGRECFPARLLYCRPWSTEPPEVRSLFYPASPRFGCLLPYGAFRSS